jgi:hypothetical protein
MENKEYWSINTGLLVLIVWGLFLYGMAKIGSNL